SSDVCSSDLAVRSAKPHAVLARLGERERRAQVMRVDALEPRAAGGRSGQLRPADVAAGLDRERGARALEPVQLARGGIRLLGRKATVCGRDDLLAEGKHRQRL